MGADLRLRTSYATRLGGSENPHRLRAHNRMCHTSPCAHPLSSPVSDTQYRAVLHCGQTLNSFRWPTTSHPSLKQYLPPTSVSWRNTLSFLNMSCPPFTNQCTTPAQYIGFEKGGIMSYTFTMFGTLNVKPYTLNRILRSSSISILSSCHLVGQPDSMTRSYLVTLLIHFSAQRKHFLWDRGCMLGLLRGCVVCVRRH